MRCLVSALVPCTQRCSRFPTFHVVLGRDQSAPIKLMGRLFSPIRCPWSPNVRSRNAARFADHLAGGFMCKVSCSFLSRRRSACCTSVYLSLMVSFFIIPNRACDAPISIVDHSNIYFSRARSLVHFFFALVLASTFGNKTTERRLGVRFSWSLRSRSNIKFVI